VALVEQSRLGRYVEFAPPRDLRHIVTALWSFERPLLAPPIPGSGHRLVPDSELSIVVEIVRDATGAVTSARTVFCGPITKPRFFAPEAGFAEYAARLRPEVTADLFGVHPSELADTITPVSMPRLLATPDTAAPLAAIVTEMRRICDQYRISRDAQLASVALRRVNASRTTTLRLGAIARSMSTSERHLRRVIRNVIGLSPKRLHRVARFIRATLAADRQPAPDWARIAGECGYYDQAHMIDEFQSIALATPAELWRERRLQGMSDFSNHDVPAT
jgi:AraC-like DNA-binding protein